MPQSMQRAPCSRSIGSACGSANSLKSLTRSAIGRLRGPTRCSFMNPPSSPMRRQNLFFGLHRGLRGLGLRRAARECRLVGAISRGRSVLVLARRTRLARLLVAVGRGVGVALTGAHRPGAVAVAVLGDNGRLAGLDVVPLGQLAQRALVV